MCWHITFAVKAIRKKAAPFRMPMRVRRKKKRLRKNENKKGDDASNLSALIANEVPAAPAAKAGQLNVILVSDCDLLNNIFFNLRANMNEEFMLYQDNVTFVLNIIDESAGESTFQEIRSRTYKPYTLQTLDARTEMFREKLQSERNAFKAEVDTKISTIQDGINDKKLQYDIEMKKLNPETDSGRIAELNQLIEIMLKKDVQSRSIDDQRSQ